MTSTEQTDTPTAPVRVEWAPVPRVNLLQPEILESRRFSRVQHRLGAALVGVVVLAGLGTWWAQTQVNAAAADLQQTRDETAPLLAEQAKYNAVPAVIAQVEAAETTREQAMATDVLWYRYMNDVALATTPDVWLTAITATMDASSVTGQAATGAAGDPLAPPGIGTLAISGGATDYDDVAGWLVALDKITGIKGSVLTAAAKDASVGTTATVTFTTNSTITSDALSHRYDREAG
jgi:Tfp pilus assembly protein PilN